MKILVLFVPVIVFLVQLIVVNLTAGQQVTSDPLLPNNNSLPVEEAYIFQNRLVERLNSLVEFVDQNISTMLSEERNPPYVKLLKGICPEMLMQEPNGGLRFRCHVLGTNDCYCFSHKKFLFYLGWMTKVAWYRAEAFCRRFGMTLADLSLDKVRKFIEDKVNDPSMINEKGEWYWTSATDRFVRGQMIWMNTGRLYKNPDNSSNKESEIDSCLKFSSSHKGEFSSNSCFQENHFLCQKFLDFFPLHDLLN